MKNSYNEFLNKRNMKIELKNLKKAMGMVGIQVNEQQVELIVEFCKILDEKGLNVTLGDVERISDEVQARITAKQQILQPGKILGKA